MSLASNQETVQIEHLLRQYYPAREIKSVAKLTGDASSRKYYRVKMDDDTYIVCLEGSQNQTGSLFVEIQELLHSNSIRVPQIIDYKKEAGLILEEDLGSMALLNILARAENSSEIHTYYKQCIDQLILIHKINCAQYPKSQINQYEFDEAKLSSEVGLSIDNFLRYYLKSSISVVDEETIRTEYSVLNSEIANYRQVLCHRDYHSRNLMIKNDELIVIDFQDARRGPPSYDLVSLLEDSYFTISTSLKAKLKERYWEQFLNESGLVNDFSEFEDQYNLMACQRIFKAIGSFSYIYRQKNDARYLKYIGSSFDNLIFYLNKTPSMEKTKQLLRKFYYDS